MYTTIVSTYHTVSCYQSQQETATASFKDLARVAQEKSRTNQMLFDTIFITHVHTHIYCSVVACIGLGHSKLESCFPDDIPYPILIIKQHMSKLDSIFNNHHYPHLIAVIKK